MGLSHHGLNSMNTWDKINFTLLDYCYFGCSDKKRSWQMDTCWLHDACTSVSNYPVSVIASFQAVKVGLLETGCGPRNSSILALSLGNAAINLSGFVISNLLNRLHNVHLWGLWSLNTNLSHVLQVCWLMLYLMKPGDTPLEEDKLVKISYVLYKPPGSPEHLQKKHVVDLDSYIHRTCIFFGRIKARQLYLMNLLLCPVLGGSSL